MIRRVIATAAIATATLGVLAVPGHAASKPNPCKLLKTSEISEQFGGATVSAGKKGISTAVSTQCQFDVAATGDQPDGEVDVRVMTTGAKVAYNGLKNNKALGHVAVPEVSGALWADNTKAMSVLKGDTLITVQPLFTSANPLPIHQLDTREQAIALIKLAQKRA
ncbi:MAG: hypothetical protein U0W40_00975 [Acidimicrobiia bacterium]